MQTGQAKGVILRELYLLLDTTNFKTAYHTTIKLNLIKSEVSKHYLKLYHLFA